MDQSSSSRASVPARRAAYVPLRARPEAESARRALRTSSSSIRSTSPAPWRRRVLPDVDLALGLQDRSSKGTDLNNKVQWRQGCQDSGLVLGCHARVESLRRPARGSSFVSTPPPAQGETSRPPAHVPTPRAVDSVIPVSGVLSVRAASSMLCALRMPRVGACARW